MWKVASHDYMSINLKCIVKAVEAKIEHDAGRVTHQILFIHKIKKFIDLWDIEASLYKVTPTCKILLLLEVALFSEPQASAWEYVGLAAKLSL